MAWTYDGAPGTSTAAGRRDAVRLLIGDTDTTDQQITDEEISFFLDEAADQIYTAAVSAARAIAAAYARLVTNSIDSVSVELSARQEQYDMLARRLEREAKTKGAGLGLPAAGGISKDTMRTVDEETDRPSPAFRSREFRNPPRYTDIEDYDIDD